MIKKIKYWIIQKAVNLVLLENKNVNLELSEVDKLVILAELKKIDRFDQFLKEFITVGKEDCYSLSEKEVELRTKIKGSVEWQTILLKGIENAPLKLKSLAEEAERKNNNI
jgi:hypothetical protein